MLETFKGFLLFIVFLVPGFIFRIVEGQFAYLDKRLDWGRFALGLLARSTIVYAIVGPWIFQSWQSGWIQSHPVAAIYLFASLALLLSVALGIFAGIVRQKEWLRKFIERFDLKPFEQHDIPTAWDRVFSKAEPSWIIVTFKDQSQVTGWYGSDSYVSSDPDERDLFISSTVRTNEKGELEIAENSGGVYIRIDEIKTIEFIAEPTISHEPDTDDSKA